MYNIAPYNSKTTNPNYASPKKRDKWLRKLMIILFIINFITALYICLTSDISLGEKDVHTQMTDFADFGIALVVGLFIYGIFGGILSIVLDLVYAIFKYPKNWV